MNLKKALSWVGFLSMTAASQPAIATQVAAYFSPTEGERAFSELYSAIRSARKEVLITVYSWSDKDLDAAVGQARAQGAKVRMILHPDLTAKKPLMDRCAQLEAQGAEVKVAPRNMHEKFVVIDGTEVINSSANFSLGARTKYSENLVFLRDADSELVAAFRREFALIWDASKDLITGNEGLAPLMDALRLPVPPRGAREIEFYSSSENLDAKPNAESSAARKQGKGLTLSLKGASEADAPWVIRDLLITSIDRAQVSIDCALNHFNISEIAEALVRASERGVQVRLAVDQQEYRERRTEDSIEMTPLFVDGWLKTHRGQVPPVRVKTYSLQPDPAHWLLNHHKFLLIDFEPGKPLRPTTRLLSGSYNLSETAEHNQFDNMVLFRGDANRSVMGAFADEFVRLWNWGRVAGDQANPAQLERWLTPTADGKLFIHFNEAMALSWPEMEAFRGRAKAIAPGLLEKLNRRTGACTGYLLASRTFFGCPPGVQ